MNKLFFVKIVIALAIAGTTSTVMAAGGRMDIGVSVPLPPPIIFPGPPTLVVIPETYVYAVPEVNDDVFFYGGWWWRPWEGRWYRSKRYDSGWGHYRGTPSFYGHVPSGWRNDYRQHRWKGHRWDSRRVPHGQVQKNWKRWERDRHWEKQNHWGVQGLRQQQQSPRKAQPQRSKQQYRDDQRRQQDNRDRDRRDRNRRDRQDDDRRNRR